MASPPRQTVAFAPPRIPSDADEPQQAHGVAARSAADERLLTRVSSSVQSVPADWVASAENLLITRSATARRRSV